MQPADQLITTLLKTSKLFGPPTIQNILKNLLYFSDVKVKGYCYNYLRYILLQKLGALQ